MILFLYPRRSTDTLFGIGLLLASHGLLVGLIEFREYLLLIHCFESICRNQAMSARTGYPGLSGFGIITLQEDLVTVFRAHRSELRNTGDDLHRITEGAR